MKPRAGLSATASPKSERSRLEVRTIAGRRVAEGCDPLGDLEAVEVGQLHVEQDQVGVELAGCGDRRARRRPPRRPPSSRSPRASAARWPGSWGGHRLSGRTRTQLDCPAPRALRGYGQPHHWRGRTVPRRRLSAALERRPARCEARPVSSIPDREEQDATEKDQHRSPRRTLERHPSQDRDLRLAGLRDRLDRRRRRGRAEAADRRRSRLRRVRHGRGRARTRQAQPQRRGGAGPERPD